MHESLVQWLSSMPNIIRQVDLNADRSLLTGLLCRSLNPCAAGRRFDWLYNENPHGPARAWIAIEQGTGKSIGAAAAFPRNLYVDGTVRLGYILGDFCIDHEYRSLGLALQLQRACLEQLLSTSTIFIYDFPSQQMMAIYKRMHIAPMDQIVRWSKLLRADRHIGRAVNRPAFVGALAAPINKLLEWKDLSVKSHADWTVGEHRGKCQEEFTQLARRVGSRYGTCIVRSSEYLNWRYMHHPLLHHELLTARRGTELMGYVVFSQTKDDAKIVDLFGFNDTAIWSALMAHVVLRLRARTVITLSACALTRNPWTELLRKWDFRPRERSPVVVCEPARTAATRQEPASPWFLMDGDRES